MEITVKGYAFEEEEITHIENEESLSEENVFLSAISHLLLVIH